MTTEQMNRSDLLADLDESLPASAAPGGPAMFVSCYFSTVTATNLGQALGWLRYQNGAYYVTGDGLRALIAYRAA